MDDVTIWSVLGLVFGTVWFFKGFKRLRLRRRILGLATSKIRSMAMGTVEIAGRVRVETPLIDPIFNGACAYYDVQIREKRGTGKHSRWVTIYTSNSHNTPFLIEDATGVARINPAKAELHFPPTVEDSAMPVLGGFNDPAVARFVSDVAGVTINRRKIVAHILREGQSIFAAGFAAPVASGAVVGAPAPVLTPAPTIRDAARALKNDSASLKSLDANKDDVVDQDEWDAGVAKKAREMQDADQFRQLAEAPVGDALVTVGCCPDGLFVLADTEENLLSRLNLSSWLGVLGGPSVAIASLAYLFLKYHRSF
jgi:hypothetical protein